MSEIHPDRLAAWLTARGERAYRAGQILTGSHRPNVSAFGDRTGRLANQALHTRQTAFIPVRADIMRAKSVSPDRISASDGVCTGVSDGAMARVEVITGPEQRRRWSEEQ